MEEVQEIPAKALAVVPSAIFSLPKNLLGYILRFLPPSQLSNFASVSRAAQRVVASEDFNKYWYRRLQNLNQFCLQAITNYVPNEFYYSLFWHCLEFFYLQEANIDKKKQLIRYFGPEVALLLEHYYRYSENIWDSSISVQLSKNNTVTTHTLLDMSILVATGHVNLLDRVLTQQPAMVRTLVYCDKNTNLLSIASHFEQHHMMFYLLNLPSRLDSLLSHFEEFTELRNNLKANPTPQANAKYRLNGPANDDSILQDRCRKNDIAIVKLLLSHPKIAVQNQNLVMIAFENHHFQLLEILLKDPRTEITRLTELLTAIIDENRRALIRPLVARIGFCDEYIAAVLKCASERNMEYFDLFLDAGISSNFHAENSFENHRKSLINNIFEINYPPLLKILFEKFYFHALTHMIAFCERKRQGTTLAFFREINIDYSQIRTQGQNTILHLSASSGFNDLLTTLLREEKVRELISMTNANGQTPLTLACIHHDIAAIQALFDPQEIKIHMNSLIDEVTLAHKLIESGMLFIHPELILNYELNESYRDASGKSYLHLLCEQTPLPEQAIMYYIYQHPFLIATLPEKTLTDSFHRCSNTLAKDLIMLGTHIPRIKLNSELERCVKLKNTVLKCLAPWNFKKLTALSQKHAADHDFKLLINILIKEDEHPRHLTSTQRQALKSLITVAVRNNHYSDSDSDSDNTPVPYNY